VVGIVIVRVGVTRRQVVIIMGACATIASGSLLLHRRPPSLRGCHCCCHHCRSLIAVNAALSSSLLLAACGCYGLTLAPAAMTVAQVSMWGGGLGYGKVMVGVAPGQPCELAINVSTMWA